MLETRDVNIKSMLRSQREALIMERLTSSPRIVNAYGHCGTSILVETMSHSALDAVIPIDEPPGLWNKMNREVRYAIPFLLRPPSRSRLTTAEKLDMAILMSESIAELHGFADGMIVNTDISLMQFLIGLDGVTIKLNDFNAALIPNYSTEEARYCKVKRWRWRNTVRLDY